jgi:hypothetical protein
MDNAHKEDDMQKWDGTWILKGSERLISIKNIEFSPIRFVYQKITSHPEYSAEKFIIEAESKIYPSLFLHSNK